jgi:hypothetical protein
LHCTAVLLLLLLLPLLQSMMHLVFALNKQLYHSLFCTTAATYTELLPL